MLDDEFKDINIYDLGGSAMMVDVDIRRKQAPSLSLSLSCCVRVFVYSSNYIPRSILYTVIHVTVTVLWNVSAGI